MCSILPLPMDRADNGWVWLPPWRPEGHGFAEPLDSLGAVAVRWPPGQCIHAAWERYPSLRCTLRLIANRW